MFNFGHMSFELPVTYSVEIFTRKWAMGCLDCREVVQARFTSVFWKNCLCVF